MAISKIKKHGPMVNVVVCGAKNAGKKTFTKAFIKNCENMPDNEDTYSFHSNSGEIHAGPQYASWWVQSPLRNYNGITFDSQTDFVYASLSGFYKADVAIVLISFEDGIAPDTSRQLEILSQMGVENVIGVVNKTDTGYDPDMIEVVSSEFEDLIDQFSFSTYQIFEMSALKELNNPTYLYSKIFEILDCLDNLDEPLKAKDKQLLMNVNDTFKVATRGIAASCQIVTGKVKMGDLLEVIGKNRRISTRCTGIEFFRQIIDEAQAGDNVNILLRGLNDNEVTKGDVIGHPETLETSKSIMATIFVLTKQMGGIDSPLLSGSANPVKIRNGLTYGVMTLDGVDKLMPGSLQFGVKIDLMDEMVVEKGLTFTIRNNGHNIAVGIITKI